MASLTSFDPGGLLARKCHITGSTCLTTCLGFRRYITSVSSEEKEQYTTTNKDVSLITHAIHVLIVFCVGGSKAPPVLWSSYSTGRMLVCS